MAAAKKTRFCPASFFALLAFGRLALDRQDARSEAAAPLAALLEFGPLGVSVRTEKAVILDYFAYSKEPDGGETLRAAYALNGGRRFRLTREQIKNNIWGIK